MKGQFCRETIDKSLAEAGIDFERLDIQELWKQISILEQKLNVQYLRMDFGIPGLPPPDAAINAHLEALSDRKIVSRYPPSEGVTELKVETAEFLNLFLGIQLEPEWCLPTCGSTEAAFIAQAISGRRYKERRQILHLEPGYPPIKAQTQLLGLESCAVDLYACRGRQLIDVIQSHINEGHLAAISWSSPNNPTSMVLSEEELRDIGMLCEWNDVVAIEDAAYLGMIKGGRSSGLRQWNSIAQYTDNFFLLLSASKMFSYAGERIGMLVSSAALMGRDYEAMDEFFGCKNVGRAIKRTIFNLTAGAPHTAQYAIARVLKAINQGQYDFVKILGEYGNRARAVRDILLRNGFYGVYEPIHEESEGGFYLTFGFPGLTAAQLLKELLYHGITVLPLSVFGSRHEGGVRACVGLLEQEDMPCFEHRISEFSKSRVACPARLMQ